jgi:glutathione synthase/RimK-type ligase-like ATP-grasp enzyme
MICAMSRKGDDKMRQVASKWAKFKVLRKHDGVAKHLPATRIYDTPALRDMLARHHFVVVKPRVGSGGLGVVKIEKRDNGTYNLHHGRTAVRGLSWNALVDQVNRIRRGRTYLIQQGIRMAKINGRNVDYRVKLVRVGSRWQIRAFVARLSGNGLFVTNLCRGGRLMKGNQALKRTFPLYVKGKRDTMISVARTCTALLEKRYPGLGQLGYDFTVDEKGDIWLFEVNTRPQ